MEGKWRQIQWTSAKDYPYPTVFICNVTRYHKEDPDRADGFFILNRDADHYLYIPAKSDEKWTTRENGDKRYPGYEQRTWEIDKDSPFIKWRDA